MPITFTTTLDKNVSAESHVNSITSEADAIISVSVNVESHTKPVTSSSERIVTLVRPVESHSEKVVGGASRGQTNYVGRTTESHSEPTTSFAYTDRTSLELIDYTVEWDDDKAVWYTPWIQETRVFGREDRFVLRATTVDDAKRPAAKVCIQYDSDGNGTPDEVSEPIEVGREQTLHEVPDIPIDDDGWYRMKIDEYSGYNSLTSLDMGIVH